MKTFYHVTTPERARSILEEGFDNHKNPNYAPFGRNEPKSLIRIFMSKSEDIQKWIRIISREMCWDRVAILQITFKHRQYYRLFKKAMEMWIEPFIVDFGDQIIVQFNRNEQPEMKIELFEVRKV